MRDLRKDLNPPPAPRPCNRQDSITTDINMILKSIKEKAGPSSYSQFHFYFWRI